MVLEWPDVSRCSRCSSEVPLFLVDPRSSRGSWSVPRSSQMDLEGPGAGLEVTGSSWTKLEVSGCLVGMSRQF